MGKRWINKRALKVSMRTHRGLVWDSGSPPGTGGVARSAGVV